MHYHLMVTPPDARSLPATMKELGERYVQYFNRRHDRIGTLWNGRYRGLLIHDERYWLTCLRYIEQNPVRAGMVRTPDDFAWSSYRFHALGAESDWLVPHWLYLELGSTPEERQSRVSRDLRNTGDRGRDVRTAPDVAAHRGQTGV